MSLTELLFNAKTRQELAEIAATQESKYEWTLIAIRNLLSEAERIVQISQELDNLNLPPKAREHVRDLRYYSRLMQDKIEKFGE